MDRDRANAARFDPESTSGHYESWFIRGNSLDGAAFWIRYTIFQPKGAQDAVGERWAIIFRPNHADVARRIVAVKDEVPMAQCAFSAEKLDARIDTSTLDDGGARGECSRGDHSIRWDLTMEGGAGPLLLLPERLYSGSFPKAKALVSRCRTRFSGEIQVDGERLPIDSWVGSQNHNWGLQHTDRYAWGQVAQFKEREDAFLELSTAQVDIGPLSTPWLTPIVLHLGAIRYEFNALWRAVKNRGEYGANKDGTLASSDHPRWTFSASKGRAKIRGTIDAPAESFVALPYGNPPGGTKICLNTKTARCSLTLTDGDEWYALTSDAAAFEILTDECPPAIRRAF